MGHQLRKITLKLIKNQLKNKKLLLLKMTKKGKIYKIIAITDNFDEKDTYYGSTMRKYLCERWRDHKKNYKYYKNGIKSSYISSIILFEKYGLENCKIILCEEIDFSSIDELRKKENEYITNKKCCNKMKSFITEEQRKQQKKQWGIEHKEHKKEYDKKRREDLKYILCADNICECGGKYKTTHKSCHIKTKKHLKYLQSL
jgi:hypothetical protein